MDASLRIELFPADLSRCVDFYRSLGFDLVREDDGPPRYAYLRAGSVRIGAVESHPVDPALRAVPTGTEIVIEVDDVAGVRDAVVAAGIDLDADLTLRPWGLTDFRVCDPDGYYLRFTDR